MSLKRTVNPNIKNSMVVTSVERPAFETDPATGEPDPKTFTMLTNFGNGESRRFKMSPMAYLQIAVGEGTEERPQPVYLVDTFRRFVLRLDKKPESHPNTPDATILRVDFFREQNVSYGFKHSPTSRTQDKDAEVEIHPDGALFITSFPSGMKSKEHAVPILNALSIKETVSVGDKLGAGGIYRVNRIEGITAFIGVV